MATDTPLTTQTGRLRGSGRSWIDVGLDLVEAVPFAPWGATAIIFVAGIAISLAIEVASGLTPDSAGVVSIAFNLSFSVAFIIGLHVVDRVARRSLVIVRSALAIDDAGFAALSDDLLRTPPTIANIGLALGIVSGISSLLSSPESYGLTSTSPFGLWVVALIGGGTSTLAVFAFVSHAIHQLRRVTRIHRELVIVDLYRLQPLYAFASLSAWTGMVLIGVTVYGLVAIQAVLGIDLQKFSAADFLTVGLLFGVAVACFGVPLLGLHGRIVAAKQAELARAIETLQRAVQNLDQRLDQPGGADLTQARNGVDGAIAALGAIRAISPWPWRPETFRGFASALGLPIVLFIIQGILIRFLPR